MTAIYVQRGQHHGEVFRGKNAETIVRRVWGKRAVIWWARNPNAPHDGTVGIPTGSGISVLAEFRFDS